MPNPFFTIPDGNYIFREVGDDSLWMCVSHDLWSGLTLADVLRLIDVELDTDAQFSRIIRFHERTKRTLTIRHYNDAKITLMFNTTKF